MYPEGRIGKNRKKGTLDVLLVFSLLCLSVCRERYASAICVDDYDIVRG